MPPKRKIGKSNKAKNHKARAETLNTVRHHGRAAHQFPAPRDDDYEHTESSHSDAESAEEGKGGTSQGTNIYIYVIYCMILIEYSS
jgi:hypothetical protein